jgi:hypothetical protein
MDLWRLAFMFDAQGGDLQALEAGLGGAGAELRRLAGDAQVRTGVALRDPRILEIQAGLRPVDGAIEVTVDPLRRAELPQIAASLRELVSRLAAPGSVAVMTGPMFPMVPARDGETFLSLAFKRDPATTQAQFQQWWRYQHAPLCVPILSPQLLAYDQVHVDHAATEAVSAAFGAPAVLYDAYDNLTWASPDGFLQSVSDPQQMQRILEDERGRIDNSTRRHAMMRRIG